MKYIIGLIFLVFTYDTGYSQLKDLSSFSNLIGKTWKASGNWGDGSEFKQEVYFEYDIGKQIVIARSNGFTDQEQTKFGRRNFGIRKLDSGKGQMLFWEFDVFGGLTEGTVQVNEKNILYQYQYGDSYITDMWEYVNDSTYNFIVGSYDNGQWQQKYLETKFVRVVNASTKEKFLNIMISRLSGKWQSKAWNGVLTEWWHQDLTDGNLSQKAEYVENGKVVYSAENRVEVVNEELILFTVINGNNPKIFKATTLTENQITFENSDYDNPSKVVYTFTSDAGFERTISGVEDGKAMSYTFDFSKVD